MQVNDKNKKEIFITAFGKVIKNLRSNNKLSSRTLAYSMDLSKTTILLAEQGKLDPQITTFCKIAEAFNLEPIQLLQMIQKELPKNFSFSD